MYNTFMSFISFISGYGSLETWKSLETIFKILSYTFGPIAGFFMLISVISSHSVAHLNSKPREVAAESKYNLPTSEKIKTPSPILIVSVGNSESLSYADQIADKFPPDAIIARRHYGESNAIERYSNKVLYNENGNDIGVLERFFKFYSIPAERSDMRLPASARRESEGRYIILVTPK